MLKVPKRSSKESCDDCFEDFTPLVLFYWKLPLLQLTPRQIFSWPGINGKTKIGRLAAKAHVTHPVTIVMKASTSDSECINSGTFGRSFTITRRGWELLELS